MVNTKIIKKTRCIYYWSVIRMSLVAQVMTKEWEGEAGTLLCLLKGI